MCTEIENAVDTLKKAMKEYDYYWLIEKYPDGMCFHELLDEYMHNRDIIKYTGEPGNIHFKDSWIYRKRRNYMKELMDRWFDYGFEIYQMKVVADAFKWRDEQ